MRRFAALLALALIVVACTPEQETTGALHNCATGLFGPYDLKVMQQCVAVCRKCEHGNTTTCTTSCTLKGAH